MVLAQGLSRVKNQDVGWGCGHLKAGLELQDPRWCTHMAVGHIDVSRHGSDFPQSE